MCKVIFELSPLICHLLKYFHKIPSNFQLRWIFLNVTNQSHTVSSTILAAKDWPLPTRRPSQRHLFIFLPSAAVLFFASSFCYARVSLIDIPAITAMNENCVFLLLLAYIFFRTSTNSCIHATRLASLTVLLVRFVVLFLFVCFVERKNG